MRLTYILAVVVAATLHTSATAFSPVQDSKAAIENGAAATVVDSVEGGRQLRRVDDDYDDLDDDLDDLDEGDDDSFDEERGLAHVLKKVDPFKNWKKSMEAMKKPTAADIAESKKLRRLGLTISKRWPTNKHRLSPAPVS